MVKGDILMQKKSLLLQKLYERGAIEPYSGISPDVLREDIDVSEQANIALEKLRNYFRLCSI